jgi:hypothetical protein
MKIVSNFTYCMMYLFIEHLTHPLILCFKTAQLMSWIVQQARETRVGNLHLKADSISACSTLGFFFFFFFPTCFVLSSTTTRKN